MLFFKSAVAGADGTCRFTQQASKAALEVALEAGKAVLSSSGIKALLQSFKDPPFLGVCGIQMA